MKTLQIPTAPVFRPLLQPARYKGAHGGRGSGKSHFFAELLIEDCLCEKGMVAVCIREVQKTLANSSKRLIENKIQALGVGSEFRVFNDKIETPGDGIILFQGMQDHTAESIKSLEGAKRAWIEEAQGLSHRSLSLLRPTIRATGSEIWASWNPTRKADAIDEFFRGNSPDAIKNGWKLPAGAIVVQANWRDNPWFNDVLEAERQLELQNYPDRYDHTWEGGYARAFEGAYFARQIAEARLKGRIGRGVIEADPLMQLKAFVDIGGAGAKADAMSIWITQWVGPQIRILDYIEGLGQPLEYYVNELRSRGHGRAIIQLPHDGTNANAITGKRYVDHWREAGFECPEPIPNQGAGAAMQRVEAVRRIFPFCWFSETPAVEGGLDALGYYHERKDETRNIGLGPDHNWASHAADAFGLLAICYEAPYNPLPRPRYSSRRSSGGSWESA
jgi:phage terminase large subunit